MKDNSIVYIHTLDEMLDFLDEKHVHEKKGLEFNKTIKLVNKKLKPIIDIGEKDSNALYQILKIRNMNGAAEIAINKYNIYPRFSLDEEYLKIHKNIINKDRFKFCEVGELISFLETDCVNKYDIILRSDFVGFHRGTFRGLMKILKKLDHEKKIKYNIISRDGRYHMDIFTYEFDIF